MTDTNSKTQKPVRNRMPVVGQRVPRETIDAFNKVACEEYNTTPAHALRCLMNAFASRKGKGVETLLKVQVSAGVSKAEVRQEIANSEKRIIDAIEASTKRIQKQGSSCSASDLTDATPRSNKPKRLKSVRWDADIFEQLEARANDVGGFSKLVNLIAGEWLKQRPEGSFETIRISFQLAKEIEANLKRNAS